MFRAGTSSVTSAGVLRLPSRLAPTLIRAWCSATLHQEDDNVPQYGVPYALNVFNEGPLPGVPSSAYYGYANVDTQEIGVDAFTATVSHELSENVTLAQPGAVAAGGPVLAGQPTPGYLVCGDGYQPMDGRRCAPRRAPSRRIVAALLATRRTRFSSAKQTSPSSLRQARSSTRWCRASRSPQRRYHRDNGNALA